MALLFLDYHGNLSKEETVIVHVLVIEEDKFILP